METYTGLYPNENQEFKIKMQVRFRFWVFFVVVVFLPHHPWNVGWEPSCLLYFDLDFTWLMLQAQL